LIQVKAGGKPEAEEVPANRGSGSSVELPSIE
jgi:hypothetical protein